MLKGGGNGEDRRSPEEIWRRTERTISSRRSTDVSSSRLCFRRWAGRANAPMMSQSKPSETGLAQQFVDVRVEPRSALENLAEKLRQLRRAGSRG